MCFGMHRCSRPMTTLSRNRGPTSCAHFFYVLTLRAGKILAQSMRAKRRFTGAQNKCRCSCSLQITNTPAHCFRLFDGISAPCSAVCGFSCCTSAPRSQTHLLTVSVFLTESVRPVPLSVASLAARRRRDHKHTCSLFPSF